MTLPIVRLPDVVGTRSVINAALIPFREDPRLAVSFRGVRSITASALSEAVMTGTNYGTRPLHLLDASAAVREEVDSFLEDEPMFAGWVSFEAPAPPPVPEPQEVQTFDVEGGSYTREQAATLVEGINLWLAQVE